MYSKKILDFTGLKMKEINKALGHRKAEHFLYWNTSQFGMLTKETYEELEKTFQLKEMEGYMTFEEVREEYKKHTQKKIFNLEGENKKSNILKYKKDYGRLHPTQKPVELLIDLVKTYSNEGDTVFDFTMGSGSTGVACVNTGRKFIGVELDENYYKIAENRIKEVKGQL